MYQNFHTCAAGPSRYPVGVTILGDLGVFLEERRRCGDLDGDVQEATPHDWRVWMACSCGARLEHRAREMVDG